MTECSSKPFPQDPPFAFSCLGCKELLLCSRACLCYLRLDGRVFIAVADSAQVSIREGATSTQLAGLPSVRADMLCESCGAGVGFVLRSAPPALQPLLGKPLLFWDRLQARDLGSWKVVEQVDPQGFVPLPSRSPDHTPDQAEQVVRSLKSIRKSMKKENQPSSMRRSTVDRMPDSTVLFEETYHALEYLGQVVTTLHSRCENFETVLKLYHSKFQEQIPLIERLMGFDRDKD
jgi:hypothetical protein